MTENNNKTLYEAAKIGDNETISSLLKLPNIEIDYQNSWVCILFCFEL
jgi:hypothetical protein